MQIHADDLEAAVRALPKMAGGFLELLPPLSGRCIVERAGGEVGLILQLVVYDRKDDESDGATPSRSVCDIKEQEVYFVPASCRDEPDRVRAYVRGWGAAVREVLPAVHPEVAERMMPYGFTEPSVLRLAKAETVEDFKSALLKKSRLGRLLVQKLPPPVVEVGESRLTVTPGMVSKILAELFPIVGERSEIVAVSGDAAVYEANNGGIHATLRLVGYERPDKETVRDIKEQEVFLIPAKHRHDEARVRAYLEGWASAISAVLRRPVKDVPALLLPADFVRVNVLDLATPEEAADFERAFLQKSRLGRFVR
jgi:hypothetical protein